MFALTLSADMANAFDLLADAREYARDHGTRPPPAPCVGEGQVIPEGWSFKWWAEAFSSYRYREGDVVFTFDRGAAPTRVIVGAGGTRLHSRPATREEVLMLMAEGA